ncbi:DUF445 family protein [Chitinophaga pendula]|uniref:DUF445 domain-containing protein n=1 Tax=Chitinophaga TaxID=79328 RepID=UPI000BAE810F|nr:MULTISPECIES: DUF445 family protein [Chitinophaga]ASZ12063.1 DUF445 domain-containing protein [Chitinophaga sp. MD30]UCJ04903.1 DUF445 family protein [Chitinophaga pendula]
MSVYLIPFISAFIGWFTNWIAIKMLFHPKLPVKIGPFVLQGIFPKRQRQFAEKLGKLVADELLSFEDIRVKLTDPEKVKNIIPMVEEHLDHFLRNKLPQAMPVLAMFIGDSTINQIKTVLVAELDSLFPKMIDQYLQNTQSELDLERIVTEKVSNFSSDKLEQILQGIMSKEFRFVEIIGGVLGFVIGLIQLLMTR